MLKKKKRLTDIIERKCTNMDVEVINKKRKRIVALSLTLTILVFVLFLVLGFLFFFAYWYYVLISIVLIILLLYLESKLLIMPLYHGLVVDLFKITFQNRYPHLKITASKDKNNQFGYFFNEDKAVISNHILLSDDHLQWDMFDFALNTSKKDKEKPIYGKYIKLSMKDICKDRFVIFSQDKNLTLKFKEYFTAKYDKTNDFLSTIRKNRKYVCCYNEHYDFDLLNCFDDIDEFNVAIFEPDQIELLVLNKEDGFHFRLQDKLNHDVIYYLKDKYTPFLKVVDKIIQVVERKKEKNV